MICWTRKDKDRKRHKRFSWIWRRCSTTDLISNYAWNRMISRTSSWLQWGDRLKKTCQSEEKEISSCFEWKLRKEVLESTYDLSLNDASPKFQWLKHTRPTREEVMTQTLMKMYEVITMRSKNEYAQELWNTTSMKWKVTNRRLLDMYASWLKLSSDTIPFGYQERLHRRSEIFRYYFFILSSKRIRHKRITSRNLTLLWMKQVLCVPLGIRKRKWRRRTLISSLCDSARRLTDRNLNIQKKNRAITQISQRRLERSWIFTYPDDTPMTYFGRKTDDEYKELSRAYQKYARVPIEISYNHERKSSYCQKRKSERFVVISDTTLWKSHEIIPIACKYINNRSRSSCTTSELRRW